MTKVLTKDKLLSSKACTKVTPFYGLVVKGMLSRGKGKSVGGIVGKVR